MLVAHTQKHCEESRRIVYSIDRIQPINSSSSRDFYQICIILELSVIFLLFVLRFYLDLALPFPNRR